MRNIHYNIILIFFKEIDRFFFLTLLELKQRLLSHWKQCINETDFVVLKPNHKANIQKEQPAVQNAFKYLIHRARKCESGRISNGARIKIIHVQSHLSLTHYEPVSEDRNLSHHTNLYGHHVVPCCCKMDSVKASYYRIISSGQTEVPH